MQRTSGESSSAFGLCVLGSCLKQNYQQALRLHPSLSGILKCLVHGAQPIPPRAAAELFLPLRQSVGLWDFLCVEFVSGDSRQSCGKCEPAPLDPVVLTSR